MNVRDIFETMDYGPAPEDASEAQAWLKSHDGKFGQFINGAWTKPNKLFATRNPATGRALAKISQATKRDVNAAVAKPQGPHRKDGRRMPSTGPACSMPLRAWCKRTPAFLPRSKRSTTASRSAKAATSTFPLLRGTSIITQAWRNSWTRNCPTAPPLALRGRSSPGISRF